MQLPAGASFQVPTMAQVMPRCGYLNPKTPNYLYCSYIRNYVYDLGSIPDNNTQDHLGKENVIL